MTNQRCALLALTLLGAFSSAAAAQDWYLRTPPVSPPAREGHAMAYDAARQRVVLHGGANGPYPYLNDTWEWDGQTWRQCNTPASTPFRADPALAYDTTRQRVLLFGGYGATDILQEWDGSAWRQIATPSGPSIRYSHAMAYDSVRQMLVVHAGMHDPFMMLADLWEWDSAGWKQHKPAVVPPFNHAQHAMAYDAARGRTVMYGMGHNCTWEWDGSVWTSNVCQTLPPVGWGHAMAYHAVRQRVMLFGGSPTTNTLFEWDGFNWSQLKPATLPVGRHSHAMAYDAARDCIVVFGGRGINGLFADTWEYGFPAAITLSGSARPGGKVDLHLRTMSDYGLPYQAGSSLGTGPIPVGNRRIGLSPDALLQVSAGNLWPWIFKGYRGTLDPRGQAAAAIHIPNLPVLIGTRIHTAFVTLDPASPWGIRSISATVTVTVTP